MTQDGSHAGSTINQWNLDCNSACHVALNVFHEK